MNSVHFSTIQHALHPLAFEEEKLNFSLKTKIQAFAVALFVAIATALLVNKYVAILAGLTVFYGVTAFEKMKMIATFNGAHPQENRVDVEQNPSEPLEPSKQKHPEPADQIRQKQLKSAPPQESKPQEVPQKPTIHKIQNPTYDTTSNQFTNVDLRAEKNVKDWQKILKPEVKKNIQALARFGDWKGMGYNIDSEAVKRGKPFRLLEKMAVEMPELGHFVYFDKRGNGECGYRTLVDGIIYGECILTDNVDNLKQSLQTAFDSLVDSWNSLSFTTKEKVHFEVSKDQALQELERMKGLSIEERIALLQDEAFLAPFLMLVRYLIVSQTKSIDAEKPADKILANDKEAREILELIGEKEKFSEKEAEFLSYALANYALDALLGNGELPDAHGNDDRNKNKESIRKIVQQVHQADQLLLKRLCELYRMRNEFQNKEDILATPLPEYLDLGITLEEFLKRKALGNQDSPRALWALASDFTALGYALNKNICCIFRDAFKDKVFDVVKTFRDRPPYFYGLNLTTQAHYNALLPL